MFLAELRKTIEEEVKKKSEIETDIYADLLQKAEKIICSIRSKAISGGLVGGGSIGNT